MCGVNSTTRYEVSPRNYGDYMRRSVGNKMPVVKCVSSEERGTMARCSYDYTYLGTFEDGWSADGTPTGSVDKSGRCDHACGDMVCFTEPETFEMSVGESVCPSAGCSGSVGMCTAGDVDVCACMASAFTYSTG